ncbi:MAG: WD40 repeat domain-containing protein, partial [Planctomycetaceae bacterium]|nr:WD40 repeat domain-containing protein [Planctomycetaceae bacterium]
GTIEAIKFFDTETWEELLTLEGEGAVFEQLRFSPNGRHLLAVNRDNSKAHVWFAPLESTSSAD